jgi:hypothetical protein
MPVDDKFRAEHRKTIAWPSGRIEKVLEANFARLFGDVWG